MSILQDERVIAVSTFEERDGSDRCDQGPQQEMLIERELRDLVDRKARFYPQITPNSRVKPIPNQEIQCAWNVNARKRVRPYKASDLCPQRGH